MKKLAICIPTYNRSEVIKEVLGCELEFLKARNVYVHVYDSSESQKTERVILDYVSQGYDNLVIHKCDSNLHANQKVYNIYKEMEKSSYDYIWIIRDRLLICEEGLDYILYKLEDNDPIYWVNILKSDFFTQTLSDLDDFLVQASYEILRFGAVILSRKDFIKGSNWDFFEKKYLNDKQIHASHVGYYFTRCVQIEDFKVQRLDLPKTAIKDGRTDKLSWEANRLQIQTECWGSVIWSLPVVYKKKRIAMQSQYASSLNKIVILKKKSEGKYNLQTFLRYRKWLKLIRPENYKFYVEAAFLSLNTLRRKYFGEFISLLEQYDEKYILGAGFVGVECAEFLDVLEVDYEGFLVSSMANNPSEKCNHQVSAVKDILHGQKAVVIVALSGRSGEFENVKKQLNELYENNALRIINFDDVRV